MAKPSSFSHSNSPKYLKVKLKPTFEVVNLVASAELGMEIDLYGLAKISHDIDYEPEQFPGAIYKVNEPKLKAALLLFNSGKIICTGAKTKEDVEKAVDHAVQLVRKYVNVHGGKIVPR